MKLAIVEVGRVAIDLNDLVGKLNRDQTFFEFRFADPVTNVSEPDLGPYEYSFRRIASLAAQRREAGDDYIIAVTSVPLENNYFSEGLSDERAIVITTHEADYLMEIARSPLSKYVAVEIVSNVLSLEYQRVGGEEHKLWHAAPLGCIFDFAIQKRDMILLLFYLLR